MSQRLFSPALAESRALMIAGMRLSGMTDFQIAHQLGLNEDTIGKIMRKAERSGVLGQLRSTILHSIAPIAVQVYEKNLKAQLAKAEPELDAARDVLKGMQVFGDGSRRESDHLDEATEELMILMRRTRPSPPEPPPIDAEWTNECQILDAQETDDETRPTSGDLDAGLESRDGAGPRQDLDRPDDDQRHSGGSQRPNHPVRQPHPARKDRRPPDAWGDFQSLDDYLAENG